VDIEDLGPALARLSALSEEEDDVLSYLRAITHFALLEVPDCVGVSITLVVADVPYTVNATDPSMAVRSLDGIQYLADGPCVTTAEQGSPTDVPDILNEQRWQAYAEASAAAGIRSSLSLPLLYEGETIGALNLYGSRPGAFDDRAHMLAEIVSGHAALAIMNADLSMRTAEDAAAIESASRSASDRLLDEAIGLLVQLKDLPPEEARRQLRDAAGRAGIEPERFAESIVRLIAD
jgi:GAF domain-containing protein